MDRLVKSIKAFTFNALRNTHKHDMTDTPTDHKYQALYDEDENDQTQAPPTSTWADRVRKGKRYIIVHSIVMGILFAVTILCLALFNDPHFRHDYRATLDSPTSTDCGSSVMEARAKGCHFEQMLYGWVPEKCFYQQLADEWAPIATKDRWYLYDNLTHEVTESDGLWSGAYDVVFTPGTYHRDHCFYVWKKLFYTLSLGRNLEDSTTGDLVHHQHCLDLTYEFLQDPLSLVEIRYLECNPASWVRGEARHTWRSV